MPNLVKNSLSPRSQGGVALAPVGNSIVSIWVMWDKFVCLPINSLKASQSLTFRYRDIEVGDEKPYVNGPDDQNPGQVLVDGLKRKSSRFQST